MLMQVLTLQIESPTKHIKTTKTRRSNLIRDQVRRLAERLLLPQSLLGLAAVGLSCWRPVQCFVVSVGSGCCGVASLRRVSCFFFRLPVIFFFCYINMFFFVFFGCLFVRKKVMVAMSLAWCHNQGRLYNFKGSLATKKIRAPLINF